jgi:hypothetical protein
MIDNMDRACFDGFFCSTTTSDSVAGRSDTPPVTIAEEEGKVVVFGVPRERLPKNRRAHPRYSLS